MPTPNFTISYSDMFHATPISRHMGPFQQRRPQRSIASPPVPTAGLIAQVLVDPAGGDVGVKLLSSWTIFHSVTACSKLVGELR
jgi:hypothetical protein